MPVTVERASADPAGVDAVEVLRLAALGRDRFQGRCHAGAPGRGFGGLVVAQGLTAAGLTVRAGQLPHSLHSYFLLPVDLEQPVAYEVDRVRDGRGYSARRVTARQAGAEVFTLTASFKAPERTAAVLPERQREMPSGPEPEGRPNLLDAWRENAAARRVCSSRPFEVLDLRHVPQAQVRAAGRPGDCRQQTWLRTPALLPDDALLHAALLVYGSDLLFAPTAALHVEEPAVARSAAPQVFMTSLDHAVWFHRPFRADEWLLFDQRSPSAADGRGFVRGELWSRDGTLVASVAQETVLRPLRPQDG